ncbi:hypothetical protein [Mucilaginibacter antarcticus]|uniref:LTXXQ motif family protein n=1 Tax=Mucilaginibacter antarcticus TaxID=1855725 RepID=A0ABW5XRC8_9SPHI
MKKLLLIAGLLTGSALFANAQLLDKSPEKRVNHQMKALEKNLKLDASQSEKITNILTARAGKVDSLKANNADKKANRKALKALAQTSEEKINSVLTADQQKSYAKLKETRKAKAKKQGNAAMDEPSIKS